MRFPLEERITSAARRVGWGVIAWALGVGGWAQNASTVPPSSGPAAADGRVLREIRDPYIGARWMVLRNLENPAGPGRTILEADGGQARGDFGAEPQKAVPVIHPGDRLVVEEHTATVDACLEATAVGSASIGSRFSAQLKIGGKVVRAVAVGPGRAALVSDIARTEKERP
jgi:hypothetical protein